MDEHVVQLRDTRVVLHCTETTETQLVPAQNMKNTIQCNAIQYNTNILLRLVKREQLLQVSVFFTKQIAKIAIDFGNIFFIN